MQLCGIKRLRRRFDGVMLDPVLRRFGKSEDCFEPVLISTFQFPFFSLAFLQYLNYGFLIITQVFLYCWWGNEMTLANQEVQRAVAETYSPYSTVDENKSLKLILVRTQRPLHITAGKFAELSLESYKEVEMVVLIGSVWISQDILL